MLGSGFENFRRSSAAQRAMAAALAGMGQGLVLWDYPLARLSSLKVGGPAKAVVFPTSVDELRKLVTGLQERLIPWRVLGRGTNILAPDRGYPGVVVVLGPDFSAIETLHESADRVWLRVEAGCALARLVSFCTQQSLAGLEFAAGIPGSIGGAIVMNAGAWGEEIGNVLSSVTLLDGQGRSSEVDRASLPFAYRTSGLPAGAIVAGGTFALRRGDRRLIADKCQEVLDQRRRKQPLAVASAGSFFKNPAAAAAGRLIEEAGLKGYRLGNAMVSEKHANFLVNAGGATAGEIKALMRLVQESVLANSGVLLEPEVHIWDEVEGGGGSPLSELGTKLGQQDPGTK